MNLKDLLIDGEESHLDDFKYEFNYGKYITL